MTPILVEQLDLPSMQALPFRWSLTETSTCKAIAKKHGSAYHGGEHDRRGQAHVRRPGSGVLVFVWNRKAIDSLFRFHLRDLNEWCTIVPAGTALRESRAICSFRYLNDQRIVSP